MVDAKGELVAPLALLNEQVLGKLDGLGEYELRRPMTPSGTNLLGIVKHLASVQAGYFGAAFGRPWPDPMPWMGASSEINDDLYALVDETSQWVYDFYRRSWAHAQQTFAVHDLDDTGTVPWWSPERRHPTLRMLLAYMTVETARHAGQIDILRETLDGKAGRFDGDESIPHEDEIDWTAYVAKVEAAARTASGMPQADSP